MVRTSSIEGDGRCKATETSTYNGLRMIIGDHRPQSLRSEANGEKYGPGIFRIASPTIRQARKSQSITKYSWTKR